MLLQTWTKTLPVQVRRFRPGNIISGVSASPTTNTETVISS